MFGNKLKCFKLVTLLPPRAITASLCWHLSDDGKSQDLTNKSDGKGRVPGDRKDRNEG